MGTMAQQQLLIARAVCGPLGNVGDAEFVLGSTRIWERRALEERIRTLLDQDDKAAQGENLIHMAENVGVVPGDIRSSHDSGLIVLDGKVYVEAKLKALIATVCKRHMDTKGFVDVHDLASDVGLASISFVEDAIRGESFVRRNDFDRNKDQSKLLEQLLTVEADVIPIPPELRAWAAEICKQHPTLRHGQLINHGTEFEPAALRMRKIQDAEALLAKQHFVRDLEYRYLPANITDSLIKLGPKLYCSEQYLEPAKAFIDVEIQENGCVAFDECLSLFLSEEDGLAAIQHILKAKKGVLELLRAPDQRAYVFGTSALDRLRAGKGTADEVCKNDEAVALLKCVVSRTTPQAGGKDRLKDLETMTKVELENEFSHTLWPLLDLYSAGIAKLKRNPVAPCLSNALLRSEAGPCNRIIRLLTLLLRIDLQLAPDEIIPIEHQRGVLDPLVSQKDDVEEFKAHLRRVVPQSFGLSCLPVDKKKEKELTSVIRERWREGLSNKATKVVITQSLLGLMYLAAYKLILFLPADEPRGAGALKEIWRLSKPMFEIPPTLEPLMHWIDFVEDLSEGMAAPFDGVDLETALSRCSKKKM